MIGFGSRRGTKYKCLFSKHHCAGYPVSECCCQSAANPHDFMVALLERNSGPSTLLNAFDDRLGEGFG